MQWPLADAGRNVTNCPIYVNQTCDHTETKVTYEFFEGWYSKTCNMTSEKLYSYLWANSFVGGGNLTSDSYFLPNNISYSKLLCLPPRYLFAGWSLWGL